VERNRGEAFAGRVSSIPAAPEVNRSLGISTTEQLDALPAFYGDDRHLVRRRPESTFGSRTMSSTWCVSPSNLTPCSSR
jgi:hypothetical protein